MLIRSDASVSIDVRANATVRAPELFDGLVEKLRLEDFRTVLMRQEETIIFALIERAQFANNRPVYDPNTLAVPGFAGSFLDYMLLETEKVHATVRRYTAPDENAFFPDDLPQPILPPLNFAPLLVPNRINVNSQIMDAYLNNVLPAICPPGDDLQYGSSATCDVVCLQALSKRIHNGKFIAEAKFQEQPEVYARLIRARDIDGIMALLINEQVEEKLLRRVRYKAACYGQDIEVAPETDGDGALVNPLQASGHKLDPGFVDAAFRDWIIPLTKNVEVLYLLDRLQPYEDTTYPHFLSKPVTSSQS